MRKWVVLAAVAVAVGAAVLLLIGRSRLQSYLAANRTRLVSRIEETLGRRISVDGIEVSIARGLGVRVTNLRIADDPRFSSDPFLTVEHVDVGVRFLRALAGRFEVSRIALDTPAVNIIRRGDTYNFASLARTDAPREPDATADRGSEHGSSATASLHLSAPRVSLRLDPGSSLGRLPGAESTTAQMPIGLVLRTPDLQMTSAGFFGADADGTAALRDLELTGVLDPSAPSRALRLQIRSRDGEVDHAAYRDLRAIVRLEADRAVLDRLTFEAFSGTVSATGSCEIGKPTLGTCELQSNLARIRVDDALADRLHTDKRLTGRLDAEFALTAVGADRERLVQTLRGTGRFVLADGTLKQVNLAARVLRGRQDDSILASLLSPRVRQKYAELLDSSDTRFDRLAGTLTISEARATSDDLIFVTPHYRVLGKGRLAFDTHVHCDATFVASETLTKDITGDFKMARLLTNREGLLEIPFRLEGRLGHVHTKLDADFVGTVLQRAFGERGADPLGKQGKDKEPRREDGRRRLRDTLERLFAP